MNHHRASGEISRRSLLQIGSLAWLGLDLAHFFRAERAAAAQPARRGNKARIKSCVFIFCDGGPSHIDTFDMKLDAPAEIRGEFRPIATSVPGQRVCEHLPMTARVMHRVAVIRSMHHRMRGHRSGVTNALTGLPPAGGDVCVIAPDPQLLPSYGARLAYLTKSATNVALPYTVRDSGIVLPGQSAGFLGPAYERLQVEGNPNEPDFARTLLKLPADVTSQRLEHRESLLKSVGAQMTRLIQRQSGVRMDACHQQAVQLLTSSATCGAFDLGQEPPKTRERYGRNIVGQSMLLARRLVEAGIPFVNVNIGDQTNEWYWDDHKNVFPGHKKRLPPFDRGFSALIEELHDRGLLESTLVISLGEFGRTPKVNPDAGRDHWPDCYCAVLAGGGVKGGHLFGASDRIGAVPTCDGATPGDLAATLFTCFGLDPDSEIQDSTGRPFRLAEGKPIPGLFTGVA